MRILIDESLPRQLAAELLDHQASTVRDQRWLGLRNGVLLRAAAEAGFRVLLTADRSVEFQQNLQVIGIAVVILGVRNRMQDIRPFVPRINQVVSEIGPGQIVRIGG